MKILFENYANQPFSQLYNSCIGDARSNGSQQGKMDKHYYAESLKIIIIALQNIIVLEKKCIYGRMYNCVCKKKQCKKKILFHHSGFPCLFPDLFMQITKFLHMS